MLRFHLFSSHDQRVSSSPEEARETTQNLRKAGTQQPRDYIESPAALAFQRALLSAAVQFPCLGSRILTLEVVRIFLLQRVD